VLARCGGAKAEGEPSQERPREQRLPALIQRVARQIGFALEAFAGED